MPELLETPSLNDLLAKSKAEVEKLAARMAAGEKPSEVEIKAILQEAGTSLKDLQREISLQETVIWERDRWQAVTDTENELKQSMDEREKLKREADELTAEMHKQFGNRLQKIDWDIRQFNRNVESLREARLTAIDKAHAATNQLNEKRARLDSQSKPAL
jgi:hypothetical protein